MHLSSETSPCEAILMELMHDLRQPLGNIETIAYCLNLLTDPAQVRAIQHLRAIEQQVARAAALLSEAAAELRRLHPSEVPSNLGQTSMGQTNMGQLTGSPVPPPSPSQIPRSELSHTAAA